MKNKLLFIISLFVAVSLWFYVYMSENREMNLTIPVNVINMQDNTMASVYPKEVAVKVRGPQGLLSTNLDYLKLDINAAGMPEGTTVMTFTPKDITNPGIEVLELNPARFELTIEPTVTTEVPVNPFIVGEPARGFKVASVSVVPAAVVVEGRQADVYNLKYVQTKYTSIAGLNHSKTFAPEILNYEKFKGITPEVVKLTVEIEENIENQIFTQVPVNCIQKDFKLPVKEYVSVAVRGRADYLDSLNKEYLIYADCSGIKESGVYLLNVYPTELDKITIEEIIPDMIEISIK